MLHLPPQLQLLQCLQSAFTRPSFTRFLLLILSAIVTTGPRTVSRLLWTLRCFVQGHPCNYHRLLSRAPWSMWTLGHVLSALVIELLPADQPILISGDDTAEAHPGQKVYGRGRHRDPVRSSKRQLVWLFGHRWVTLAILVQFPFAPRPWALPVLLALYRSVALDEQEGRRHKTPSQLARQLLAVLVHWFPQRHFIFLGDGEYSGHRLARFCHRHRRHLTLVGLFHGNAPLYAPPPAPTGRAGRRRQKGQRLPSPEEVVATATPTKTRVAWYGGTKRRIAYVSGTALWYSQGQGVVPVRWVFVHDREGQREDRYFYSTDAQISAVRIIALYTARWSIEVTFEEARAHLGLGRSRCYSKCSVLRTTPCLLGLFTVVTLLYAKQTKHRAARARPTLCWPKRHVTFSDALFAVRRCVWEEVIFAQALEAPTGRQFPDKARGALLDYLSEAA